MMVIAFPTSPLISMTPANKNADIFPQPSLTPIIKRYFSPTKVMLSLPQLAEQVVAQHSIQSKFF